MESFVFIDCDGFRLIQFLAWLSVACLNREDDIDSLRFSIPFTWLGIKPTDLITISNLGCTLNVNDSVIAWSISLRKTYNRLFETVDFLLGHYKNLLLCLFIASTASALGSSLRGIQSSPLYYTL